MQTPVLWTPPVMPVSSQGDGTQKESRETQVQTFNMFFLLGPWALVYNGWTQGHILPGFATSGDKDLLPPVASPSPVPFTTPFSVPRQPVSPDGGHKGDGGVPALQALGSVLQLQDPGERLSGQGGGGRTARGWQESLGAGLLSFPNRWGPQGRLLEALKMRTS